MTKYLDNLSVRVDTARFGPFTFQLGCDLPSIDTLRLRVDDAQARFKSSPLAQVANQLEKEVVVKSIFGTNSIEGGTLSEEETGSAIELEPYQVKNTEQRRARNIKSAYDFSRESALGADWYPSVEYIKAIHGILTEEIPHDRNRPGLLRDNSKQTVTYVGDSTHGGRYKPPHYSEDIKLLLAELVKWNKSLIDNHIPALLRAPLFHFYFELIHPFWDGNGRTGRVLEASILLAEGFQYAPFAMANYYFDDIDYYFTLFNKCRKEKLRNRSDPNAPFVEFFLKGMLFSLNKLHDRVNLIIHQVLFENVLKKCFDDKKINDRQYAIASQVLKAGEPVSYSELRQAPWYLALYSKLTDKTRRRDIKKLIHINLINLDDNDQLWPGFIEPED